MGARIGQLVFVGLFIVYLSAIYLATESLGPAAWGLHSFGFLSFEVKVAIAALFTAGIGLILWGFIARTKPLGEEQPSFMVRVRPLRRLGPIGLAMLALAFCICLYGLRTRSHFLGDGTLWLTILKTGQHQVYNEPLAAATMTAFGSFLRAIEPSPSAIDFGLLSILCGGFFFLVCFALTEHLCSARATRIDAILLLVSLGIIQLYCGYLESYPTVMVLVFGYLWLGLRSLRREPFALTPVALSLATASHFLCLYLWPSYLYLVTQRATPLTRRVLWIVLPAVLTVGLILIAGSRPSDWSESLRIAVRVTALSSLLHNPHATSLADYLTHASDLINEAFLIMPVALLLGVAGLANRSSREWLRSQTGLFLATSALAGLLSAFTVMVPAPALDWDLFALLMAPVAVLLVGVGTRSLEGGAVPFRWGVVTLSLAATLPFLLVNASEGASLWRFKTLIGPGTHLSDRDRAYPNSILAEYYEDRGDYSSALIYAMRAHNGEPTNPRYSVKVANEYFQLQQYADASRFYEEAIHRGWDRPATRHDLGLSYALSGRTLDGVRELRRAVNMPGVPRPDYYHDLGVAYARAGLGDSARFVWEGLLKRWPGYAPTIRSLVSRYGP